jgi:hypothetical protein
VFAFLPPEISSTLVVLLLTAVVCGQLWLIWQQRSASQSKKEPTLMSLGLVAMAGASGASAWLSSPWPALFGTLGTLATCGILDLLNRFWLSEDQLVHRVLSSERYRARLDEYMRAAERFLRNEDDLPRLAKRLQLSVDEALDILTFLCDLRRGDGGNL